jgi:selenide, water dikinase
MSAGSPRLTSLSHGGGCGCKISPAVLAQLLSHSPTARTFAPLLVGTESADDAAVYQLNDHQALVATTDFFMPIVDDPHDFGRIAAANALSDVYAMGATPILALALVAMPINVLPPQVIREILRGGETVCAEAEIPIAGGHSIDSVEPIYGLAAIGVVHPRQVKRNCTARAGDSIVLGKALGVGILSAALKKDRLEPADYATLIEITTRLNRAGPDLAQLPGVSAMTDVTGFGLLGHLLEMCRGSGCGAQVRMSQVPLLERAAGMADAGIVTGASARNWASYGDEVHLGEGVTVTQRLLLCDPQTSGGLLVTCAPEAVAEVLATLRRHGCADAAMIGAMSGSKPEVVVEV